MTFSSWLPVYLTFISLVWTQVQSDEEEELAAMRLFDEIDVNKDGVCSQTKYRQPLQSGVCLLLLLQVSFSNTPTIWHPQYGGPSIRNVMT